MTAASDKSLPAFLTMYAMGYCPTSLSGNLKFNIQQPNSSVSFRIDTKGFVGMKFSYKRALIMQETYGITAASEISG